MLRRMSAAPPKSQAGDEPSDPPPKAGGKKKLILLSAPVVLLLLAAAGLWFSGVLPGLLGMKKEAQEHGHAEAAAKPGPPAYVDLPEMVANLNGTRKPAYIKVVVRIEVPKQEDVEKVK